MNRTYLTRAIRELAGVYGYTIHIDTDDRTPREIVLLPAAWLPPIRLKEVEGRLHGRATYGVELRLLHPGAKLSSERRNEVWSQTELQLFDLFTQLSTDPKVIAVENLTVQPGSGAYTPHGEISQTAKADVITCFRHPDTPHSSHRPFRCRLRIFRKKAKGTTPPTAPTPATARYLGPHTIIHFQTRFHMTFTSLPEMFSSVFGPLAYTFSNAAETELFLEILSTRDGSRIGSKRFYNTPTGTLNIAPMVRKNIRFVPSSGMTGFCNSESRSASVQLAVGTTYSEVRTFVAAHDSVKPSRILTTMPSHRIIAYGESDEITCCIPGQHTVTVTSDITAEALTYNAIGGEELTLFRLNTRSFLPSVGTITVRIATAGQTVAEIGYTVVPKCDEGCRIAWRSRAGSIEHYTFPVVKSVVQKIRKEQVLTDDAGYEDISIRNERTTTLASAFEPAAVIEALAEIAASPQVWKIDGDKYEEVDILIREQTIGRHGSLGCIEISLRPRQETRCL